VVPVSSNCVAAESQHIGFVAPASTLREQIVSCIRRVVRPHQARQRAVILCVAEILKDNWESILSMWSGWTQPKDRPGVPGTDMWGLLSCPVAWTVIVLILSSLGIYRELF
jgi:hypothetical protein